MRGAIAVLTTMALVVSCGCSPKGQEAVPKEAAQQQASGSTTGLGSVVDDVADTAKQIKDAAATEVETQVSTVTGVTKAAAATAQNATESAALAAKDAAKQTATALNVAASEMKPPEETEDARKKAEAKAASDAEAAAKKKKKRNADGKDKS